MVNPNVPSKLHGRAAAKIPMRSCKDPYAQLQQCLAQSPLFANRSLVKEAPA